MKIYHIAAMSKNRVIGRDGDLPFHLSEDLKRFKQLTHGHALLMGRRTFESLPFILPGRDHYVLTEREKINHGDVIIQEGVITETDNEASVRICHDLESALTQCRLDGVHELYVAGGGTVYEQTLWQADELRLTLVDGEIDGDTFYPELDPQSWAPSFIDRRDGFTFVDFVSRDMTREYIKIGD